MNSNSASPDPGRSPSNASDWREGFRKAAPYLGLGMQLALTMIVCTGGGYLLDRWLGTLPWLTLVGAAVGMAAVFWQVVYVSQQLGRNDTSKRSS